MTNIGMVAQVVKNSVSSGSITPHLKGRGHSVPKIPWDRLPTTAKQFDIERRNVLVVTGYPTCSTAHAIEACFQESATLPFQRGEVLKMSGTSCMRAHRLRNNN